jgi:ribosomal protein S18 acetylase RimI-like enzyme
MEKIVKNYLEIKSLDELLEKKKPNDKYIVKKASLDDFQLNKFFYKQIGKNHQWNDRLVWNDKKWIDYVSNPNVFTFVLKDNEDIAGFFELIYHKDKSEMEIAYFGLLKDYMDKKLGGYMLTKAIKLSFSYEVKRVWVHTCSLDHKNALKNYLARGMKIYNTETISTKSA